MNIRQMKRKGGVLVMFAIAMVVIIACSGLAIDVGRMYVTRTEAQSFVDALALAKAAEYIGAREENAGDVWKRYNFNNESFTNYEVGYASSPGGTYSTTVPAAGAGNVYVRATTTVDVPLLLLRVLVPDDVGRVTATAVAGVEKLTSAGEGTFPYAIRTPPNGFELDEAYTFRWGNNVSKDLEDAWRYVIANIATDASLDAKMEATAEVLKGNNPFSGNPPNVNVWCAGDATKEFLMGLGTSFDTVSSDLFSWNGAFFSGGTNSIVAAMAFGYQDQFVEEGDSISAATGMRQATVNELEWVVSHDTDTTSVTRAAYLGEAGGVGNNFRVIQVATVTFDSAYLKPGAGAAANVATIEAFLLQPVGSYGNPQSNWCATYYGGITAGSEDPIDQASGVWVVKLVS